MFYFIVLKGVFLVERAFIPSMVSLKKCTITLKSLVHRYVCVKKKHNTHRNPRLTGMLKRVSDLQSFTCIRFSRVFREGRTVIIKVFFFFNFLSKTKGILLRQTTAVACVTFSESLGFFHYRRVSVQTSAPISIHTETVRILYYY